jgi:hypothetical protein
MKENFKISANGKFLTYLESWSTTPTKGDYAIAISWGNRINVKKICKIINIKQSGRFEIIEVQYENGKTGELHSDEYTILHDEEVQYIKDFYNEVKDKPEIKNETKSGFKLKGKSIYLTQKIWRNQSKLDENRQLQIGDVFLDGVDAIRIDLKKMHKVISYDYEMITGWDGKQKQIIKAVVENLKTKKQSEKYGPNSTSYRIQPGELEEILEFYGEK